MILQVFHKLIFLPDDLSDIFQSEWSYRKSNFGLLIESVRNRETKDETECVLEREPVVEGIHCAFPNIVCAGHVASTGVG